MVSVFLSQVLQRLDTVDRLLGSLIRSSEEVDMVPKRMMIFATP